MWETSILLELSGDISLTYFPFNLACRVRHPWLCCFACFSSLYFLTLLPSAMNGISGAIHQKVANAGGRTSLHQEKIILCPTPGEVNPLQNCFRFLWPARWCIEAKENLTVAFPRPGLNLRTVHSRLCDDYSFHVVFAVDHRSDLLEVFIDLLGKASWWHFTCYQCSVGCWSWG